MFVCLIAILILPIFQQLNDDNGQPKDIDIMMIERFVVSMYERTSSLQDVNVCRRYLFTKKGWTNESLPPTNDALLQHTNGDIFQPGCVLKNNSC